MSFLRPGGLLEYERVPDVAQSPREVMVPAKVLGPRPLFLVLDISLFLMAK